MSEEVVDIEVMSNASCRKMPCRGVVHSPFGLCRLSGCKIRIESSGPCYGRIEKVSNVIRQVHKHERKKLAIHFRRELKLG